jgi:hypothetical protein
MATTYIAEAIEIITDDGYGIPTTYTNTDLGLASDGHFYLITDRFGLNGTPSVTGSTTRTVWYEGVLSRDNGSFSISRNCDFIEAGAMESVSSFSFSIRNTSAWWATLKTNGVYLARRKVKYYRVTSTNGTIFNFELRWTGIIDDQPYNEITQSIQCVDSSKDIFGSFPKTAINSVLFPKAPANSLDKFIPVVIGLVAYSPLVPITGSGKREPLCIISGVTYYAAAATALQGGDSAYVRLKVDGMPFGGDWSRLIGKYLHIISGGTDTYSLIWKIGAYSTTELYFYTTTPMGASGAGLWTSIGDTSTTPWYYEVVDIAPILIASNKTIYEIKSENGNKTLYSYNSTSRVYNSISELEKESSLSNIKLSGYPGLSIITNNADSDSALSSMFRIVPSNIKKQSESGWTTSSLPAVGASCTSLFDLDNSTGYALSKTVVSSPESTSVSFDLILPDKSILNQYQNIYLGVNLDIQGTATSVLLRLSVQLIDVYGRAITTDVNNETLYNGSASGSAHTRRTLPNFYTSLPESTDSDFDTYKTALELTTLLASTKSMNAYSSIRVTFSFLIVGAFTQNLAANIYEIGLVGNRSIEVSTEPVYSTLKGETFGTTWDLWRTTPKTTTAAIYLIGDAYEHILRNYDTAGDIWRYGTAYVIGDKVRSLLDNGNIFVCTVAGTSHASTEPTWTTTEGATYTDGTVTWKQFRKIPINTDSFETLKSQRSDWFIGRTITEKKPSIDYYKELCQQGFFISITNSEGLVKVKSWLDNITPSVTFSSSNILHDSFGQVTYSPMRRVYNDFTIQYDYNPAGDKFNKQLTITNIDKPEFPNQTEYAGTPISLGLFSATSSLFSGLLYMVTFTTSAPHGLTTGQQVSLSGNTHGYDFAGGFVNVISITVFNVFQEIVPAFASTSNGTLTKEDNSVIKWTTYAGGFQNYATAKSIWDTCHSSYLVTKTVNKCPDELGSCKWFIDPYAKNPEGNYIWSTDGFLDLDVGDDHPAVYYLKKLVNWTTWQKKQVTFETPDISTYSALEIGDPVYINDAKLTNGVQYLAWIHEKTQLPRTEMAMERIRFGITLAQEGYTASLDNLVIDELAATDIIDELSSTDIYDESGA